MRNFDVPQHFRSSLIGAVKEYRKRQDPRKKDLSPSLLDFGTVHFLLARHFGFCYGVENAIEIAYRTLDNYPDRRIFFISEMIHNPEVNGDLEAKGIHFLNDTEGKTIFPIEQLQPEDIVLIPAFGTTIEMEQRLRAAGVQLETFDTTCPFVKKVWNRAETLGDSRFTVVVHGKPAHEETRATFSHSAQHAPTLIIKDMEEAQLLAPFITEKRPHKEFFEVFGKERCSPDFDPTHHLRQLGVVNQTTMLAAETQAIANFLREVIYLHYGETLGKTYFADTRDTLCYATNENQSAIYSLLDEGADMAVVVGGYNSSNTMQLYKLCAHQMPAYFIKHSDNIISAQQIRHFDLNTKQEMIQEHYLPAANTQKPPRIIISGGASCPDSLLETVLLRLLPFFAPTRTPEAVVADFNARFSTV